MMCLEYGLLVEGQINYMLLVGLLGIGKIIIVEVFGKIYVGMGIVCYFEI